MRALLASTLVVVLGGACINWDNVQSEFCQDRPDLLRCAAIRGDPDAGTIPWAVFAAGQGVSSVERVRVNHRQETVLLGTVEGTPSLKSVPFGDGGRGSEVFMAQLSLEGFPLHIETHGGTSHDEGVALDLRGDQALVAGTYRGDFELFDGGVPQEQGQGFVTSRSVDRANDVAWSWGFTGLNSRNVLTGVAQAPDGAFWGAAVGYSPQGSVPSCGAFPGSNFPLSTAILAIFPGDGCTDLAAWSGEQVTADAVVYDPLDQGVAVTGQHRSGAALMGSPGGNIVSGSDTNRYVAVFNRSGVFQKSHAFSLAPDSGPAKLAVDPNGTLYLAGVRLESGQRYLDVIQILRPTSLDWQTSVVGSYPVQGELTVGELVAPAPQVLWMAGSLRGRLFLSEGALGDGSAGNEDIFVLKLRLDPGGPVLLNAQRFGLASANERASSLAVGPDDRYVVVGGLFTGTSRFGPFTSSEATVPAAFAFKWVP